MNSRFIIFFVWLFVGQFPVLAQLPSRLNTEALTAPPSLSVVLPVPMPGTLGATLVSGVGFLMLFRPRRYS